MGQALAQAIDLYFLDECGVAPTLPPTYTWARLGTRVVVLYEAPQGRRVNVIGALAPYGPQPRLAYHSRCGKIDSAAFVEFLWRDVARLPAAAQNLPPT
jgi:putative transposase